MSLYFINNLRTLSTVSMSAIVKSLSNKAFPSRKQSFNVFV
nr:MAG TPA: hypothetical protein [Caudoviricetes sp.]DAX31963.1 MAG TPA: hypothetical protein [Caudoviricetes sp.]